MKAIDKLKANWKWIAGVLVSVVVTFYSYPPNGLGWLMFVGLVPVFINMETAPTWKAAAFRTWLYVFLGNSAICFWVAYSVHNFAQLPWVLSYPAIALLSFAEQGSWPVLAALRHILHKKYGLRPLFWTPLALLFLDVCWPKFFPNTMGNVFYRIPWLCQIADVTGVWGLTALLAMTNELVAALILRSWPRRDLWRHGIASVVMLAISFSYGYWRYGQIRAVMENPSGTLRAVLVQPNINAALKVKAENNKGAARADVLSQMMVLSGRGVALGAELLIWPETAYPDTYHGESSRESTEVTSTLDIYAKNINIPIIFGGRDQVGRDRFNTLFYLKAQGHFLERQVYHKTILLELAEHVPLSDYVPGLGGLLRGIGGANYSTGSGPKLFQGPRDLKIGPMICLEGLYGRYVRRIVNLGADVLVNATNDAWFGPGMEPELHLYLTAFRAIETRRPIIRATNTGYSAVIDIDGSLRMQTDLNADVAADDNVPIYKPITTPYMVLGDTLFILAGLYAALPFVLQTLRRRKSKRKN